jgi:diguanylate cyclase (GGDEF)-like protein/PAS domain S-box-containing protein
LQRCNPRFEEMFGFETGEMVGKSSAMLFASQAEYEEAGERMYSNLATGNAYVSERQLKRKDGSLFWCKLVAKAIDPLRPEEGAIGIYEDITADRAAREMEEASRVALEASRDALERAVAERTEELQAANRRLQAEIGDRRQAESRAQHLADHDALTGLPNRRLLEDRLTQALAQSQRNRKQTAVMFVDLDRFKHINDSLGHAAGDVVLKECAERLVKQLRVGDTICRMGGDEFVVVLPEIKRGADAANVAAKILETVALPFKVDDRELLITPSVGISVFLGRHQRVSRRRPRRRDADPQRRRRDVPRQGNRPRQLPVFHRADEPGGLAAPRPGGRPAPRGAGGRDAGVVSADRRRDQRQGRGP